MKQRLIALRYVVGMVAISLACTLVGVAQHASGARLLQASSPASSSAKTRMVADWTRAKEFTKEYLDAMPEDGIGFKATPDIRSFAEQMLHLAAANFAFASNASGKANPYQGKNLEKMDEFKTKAGLTKVVMESYDFVIASINGLDEAKMNEGVKIFGRDL
ncbi:MAG TPA: hypothetical protein VEF04_07385, partial [Blastocatellia bacterium]|nr:hypothetical protein [Blastocatellia bacterium]